MELMKRNGTKCLPTLQLSFKIVETINHLEIANLYLNFLKNRLKKLLNHLKLIKLIKI